MIHYASFLFTDGQFASSLTKALSFCIYPVGLNRV